MCSAICPKNPVCLPPLPPRDDWVRIVPNCLFMWNCNTWLVVAIISVLVIWCRTYKMKYYWYDKDPVCGVECFTPCINEQYSIKLKHLLFQSSKCRIWCSRILFLKMYDIGKCSSVCFSGVYYLSIITSANRAPFRGSRSRLGPLSIIWVPNLVYGLLKGIATCWPFDKSFE